MTTSLFTASKLLSAITQPMFWLALWWGLALLVLWRRRVLGMSMLWAGAGGVGGAGVGWV